jgi:hypothetical protein
MYMWYMYIDMPNSKGPALHGSGKIRGEFFQPEKKIFEIDIKEATKYNFVRPELASHVEMDNTICGNVYGTHIREIDGFRNNWRRKICKKSHTRTR